MNHSVHDCAKKAGLATAAPEAKQDWYGD